MLCSIEFPTKSCIAWNETTLGNWSTTMKKTNSSWKQCWEFAHLIPEQIAIFLSKNERMSDSLKWMSDSLICSFLVSDLSDSLTIAHFLWVTWANCSWLLIFGERPERFAHITYLIWAKWAIHSHRSPKEKKWAKMSDSFIFSIKFFKIVYKTY